MSREVELAFAHAGCIKRSCLFICLHNTKVCDSTAQQQLDVAWCHLLQVAVQHKRSRSGIVIGKQFLPPLTRLASDVGRLKSKVPVGTDVSIGIARGPFGSLTLVVCGVDLQKIVNASKKQSDRCVLQCCTRLNPSPIAQVRFRHPQLPADCCQGHVLNSEILCSQASSCRSNRRIQSFTRCRL